MEWDLVKMMKEEEEEEENEGGSDGGWMQKERREDSIIRVLGQFTMLPFYISIYKLFYFNLLP